MNKQFSLEKYTTLATVVNSCDNLRLADFADKTECRHGNLNPWDPGKWKEVSYLQTKGVADEQSASC